MMKKILLMSLAASLAVVASATAEITVGDPSFEDHNPPPGGDQPMQLPWQRLNNAGFVASEGNAGMFNIPDGNNAMHPSIYEVYQDLAATYADGEIYQLTALAAGRVGSSGALDGWSISLRNTAGAVLAETAKEFDLIPSDVGPEAWVPVSVTYTATPADDGEAIRISFGNGAPGAYDFRFLVDDVHLLIGPEVPEPATMTLLGLGSLALIRRRRA